MEDGIDIVESIAINALEKFGRFNDVLKTQADEVAPFLIGTQAVDQEKVVPSPRIQRRCKIASDKPGGPGHYGRFRHLRSPVQL